MDSAEFMRLRPVRRGRQSAWPAMVAPTTRVLPSLEGLADAWEAMVPPSTSPMERYAWARACADSFGDAGDLRVVVAERAGQPRAIACLLKRRRPERLELPGAAVIYEPMDVAYADPIALEELAMVLAQRSAPLYLPRVYADSPTVPGIKRAYRGRGLVICRPALACPWIELGADWVDPERQFNGRRRSDLRRYRRRAEELGDVRTEVITPSAAELEPVIEEAIRVEAASWKGQVGTALAADPVRAVFYRRYAAAAQREGILRVAFLRIGGRAVAMQLALECAGSFWLLKIGYDQAFARCSPGILLMLETVRYSAQRGLRSYELLGTAERWTQVWTQRVRPCVAVAAYPYSPQGAMALMFDAIASARRRLALRRRGSGVDRKRLAAEEGCPT